jgi:hypothetical protein
MPDQSAPALTRDQWESRDYRQAAKDIDRWAGGAGEGAADDDDRTEYVAKLGLNERDSVIVMNRAHDRVLVPPPARAPLAAFALVGQPFGFTAADVALLRRSVEASRSEDQAALQDLARRIEALLPPTAT